MKRCNIMLVYMLIIMISIPAIANGQPGRSITLKKQGYLGVEIQDIGKKLKKVKNLAVDYGAYVENVVEGSPAERAGLEEGDVIVKFGDSPIEECEDLTEVVRKTKPKTEVKIEIYRKSDKKIITAKIGKVKSPILYFGDDGSGGVMHKTLKIPRMPESMRSFNLRIFSEYDFNGMHVQPVTKQLGEFFGVPKGKGLLVTEVENGSDAEKAGFKAGDVIIGAADSPVKDIEDLKEGFSDSDTEEVPVEIIRGGKSMKLNMKCGDDGEDDEWSENLICIPGPVRLENLHSERDGFRNIDFLKERLIDLKEDVAEKIKDIKHKLKCKFIGT